MDATFGNGLERDGRTRGAGCIVVRGGWVVAIAISACDIGLSLLAVPCHITWHGPCAENNPISVRRLDRWWCKTLCSVCLGKAWRPTTGRRGTRVKRPEISPVYASVHEQTWRVTICWLLSCSGLVTVLHDSTRHRVQINGGLQVCPGPQHPVVDTEQRRVTTRASSNTP